MIKYTAEQIKELFEKDMIDHVKGKKGIINVFEFSNQLGTMDVVEFKQKKIFNLI